MRNRAMRLASACASRTDFCGLVLSNVVAMLVDGDSARCGTVGARYSQQTCHAPRLRQRGIRASRSALSRLRGIDPGMDISPGYRHEGASLAPSVQVDKT